MFIVHIILFHFNFLVIYFILIYFNNNSFFIKILIIHPHSIEFCIHLWKYLWKLLDLGLDLEIFYKEKLNINNYDYGRVLFNNFGKVHAWRPVIHWADNIISFVNWKQLIEQGIKHDWVWVGTFEYFYPFTKPSLRMSNATYNTGSHTFS